MPGVLRPPPRSARRPAGFTLVELVVVIGLFGILAAIGASMMARPILAFSNAGANAQLSDTASRALQRMADELHQALPNSVRVTAGGGNFYLEFTPLVGVGRYRAEMAASGTAGDPLDFTDPNDASFDVLGPMPALDGSAQLVINNLGTSDGDVYAGNDRRGGLVYDSGAGNLQFTANGAFPSDSPSARFSIVEPPVSFVCIGGANGSGTLRRVDGYGFQASQPVALGSAPLSNGASSLLATHVTSCAAQYDPALQNLGMVTLSLALAQGDSQAALVQQITVDTTP